MARLTKKQLRQLQLNQRVRFSDFDDETGGSVERQGKITRLARDPDDPWNPGSPYFEVSTDSGERLLVDAYQILGPTTPPDDALESQRVALERAQRGELRSLPREFNCLVELLVGGWVAWSAQDLDEPLVGLIGTTFAGERSVSVKRLNGAHVGTYRDDEQVVTLYDERLRTQAILALKELGFPVRELGSIRPFADATLVPGFANKWKIVAVCPDFCQSEAPVIAEYYAESGRLDLGHPILSETVANLVRRHGLEVGEESLDLYQLSRPEHPADLNALRRAAGRQTWSPPYVQPVSVSDTVKQLVGEPHASILTAVLAFAPWRWPTYPLQEDDAGSARCSFCTELFFMESLNEEDGAFVGGGDCCPRCVIAARSGVLADPGRPRDWEGSAIWAIQQLTKTEFGGPPSLKQLQTPLTGGGDARLRSMALRILAPRSPGPESSSMRPIRRPRSWIEWLEAADVLRDGYRAGRGTWTKATDGHRCRSLFERHVDDFMSLHGIEHETEPSYPLDDELNPHGLRADWRLDDGTLVEALGLAGDPAYDEKWIRKQALAENNGIRLVAILPEDLVRLTQLLGEWMTPSS